MTTPRGPSDFVDAAYQIEDEAGMVKFYREWAEKYDYEMLDKLGYVSPSAIAELLSGYLTDTDGSIFDLGCGTGLTCLLLAEKGFHNLDGIDLSPDMVRVAGQRGIYRELLVGDVNQALERDDNSYDAVISSGTFTHGHVGPQPLTEVFRILKPGGYLACTVHQDLWESMGFKSRFDELTAAGSANCLQQKSGIYFRDGPDEGWFCVYQKSS